MTVYEQLKAFKKEYPFTIAWRLKRHAKIVEMHLNPDEKVLFCFAAQKGFSAIDIFSTFAVVLTNKRIILARKRLLFGYIFLAITPDMFNDLTVSSRILWCNINIDTVKELVVLSNISKRAANTIETHITEYMMGEKKKYGYVHNREDRK